MTPELRARLAALEVLLDQLVALVGEVECAAVPAVMGGGVLPEGLLRMRRRLSQMRGWLGRFTNGP